MHNMNLRCFYCLEYYEGECALARNMSHAYAKEFNSTYTDITIGQFVITKKIIDADGLFSSTNGRRWRDTLYSFSFNEVTCYFTLKPWPEIEKELCRL